MEYTFRNSPGELPATVLLTEHNITVKQGKDEYTVPYIGINQVNLDRLGRKVYRAVVHIEGHRQLVITNWYHTDPKSAEDRSRAYSTFIRVLHYHLKDKSRAHYASGSDASRLWVQVSVAASISFVLSFTAEFVGVSLFNPFTQGAILTALMGLGIFARYSGHWPRKYNPTDIPLQFLP